MLSMRLLAAATVCALPALGQTSYWIANRASSDIMRVSEWGTVIGRVPTPTTLRGCATAPDGKVWITRFGLGTFDVYDPATNTLTAVAAPSGLPYAIAFDAQGDAWITTGGQAVHRYGAGLNFVQTVTMPVGNGYGITIDGQGNKWVANRGTPASITRIDAVGAVTNFPIAGASAAWLPVGVVADFRGIGQPSRIWVTGDSDTSLAEIDGATGATLNLYTLPFGAVASPATFDRNGRIWVSANSNPNVVQIDQTNGQVLQALSFSPSNIAIATDHHGRIRTTSRVTFTGPGQPCEVRRIDPSTGALEIPTQLQQGTSIAYGTQTQLSTLWQYGLVVNPTGDLDGDGDLNFAELLNGTSPTDAGANSLFRVESFGPTLNGGTATFEVQSSTLWVVAFALGRIPPSPLPGFGGFLQLDPATVVSTSAGLGNASLPIAIPANPALVGFEFFAQGVVANGLGFDFKNLTGLKVW